MFWNRGPILAATAAFALLACGQLCAQEKMPTAENVVGSMSVKLLRGVTNVLTCPLEIPRQIDRHIDRRGAWEGSCVGFFAGLGMTVFRGIAGGVEAVLFLVPEPGFYDPLVTPAYAWQDWGAPVVE
jgi:putative exosortase-associated protein (TIGR04073 family)